MHVKPKLPDPLASAWADHNRLWGTNTYVYPVISRRSGGISIGINLNPDKACTFDCPYCQVDRNVPPPTRLVDVERIAAELEAILSAYRADGLASFPSFAAVAPEKRQIRDLCLSGDGESTMAAEFPAVCRLLRDVQSAHSDLALTLVLITNATLLHRAPVQEALADLCAHQGEIWGKLDAGSESWFQKINVSRYKLDHIEANLAETARHYPLRIQTMVCNIDGSEPDTREIGLYAERVARIQAASPARFLGVQLYSVVRDTARPNVEPVAVAKLEAVAEALRQVLLPTEIGIYP